MRAPSFRCTDRPEDGALVLHYYSHRQGLEYIVIGIVKTVAKRLHNTEVEVKLLPKESADDHTKFLIADVRSEESENKSLLETWNVESEIPNDAMAPVSDAIFQQAFPFHLIFRRSLEFEQIGLAIMRILPQAKEEGSRVTDLFDMSRPHMDFTFENVLAHINTVYVLSTKIQLVGGLPDCQLRLKGQMIYVQEQDSILFLGSPSVKHLDDLNRHGLYLSDIPLHDATRDLVLLSEQFAAEYKLTKDLEVLTDQLQQKHHELKLEKQRTDRLLYSVLPPSVANELRQGKSVAARKYDCVTLLFSGIVGFSTICANHSALTIVRMLNSLYTAFDKLTDPKLNPYVYKVETVGDKYMAVSGLPEPCAHHAKCIAILALNMIEAAKHIKIDGQVVAITIGIHSGEVVTGVIGQRMPRYCLFGNTVNLTSRTETTGEAGAINVTEPTYRLLQENGNTDDSFYFRSRGPIQMKGKAEPMQVWILESDFI
ncbi:hypothetical protein QYM36_006230 [Artemia franciscana]|nr:hypothetical protein QYM36_006230 [Artemia franciscana]